MYIIIVNCSQSWPFVTKLSSQGKLPTYLDVVPSCQSLHLPTNYLPTNYLPPQSLVYYICFFKKSLIFTTNKCENCPTGRYYLLLIWPHESPPITTSRQYYEHNLLLSEESSRLVICQEYNARTVNNDCRAIIRSLRLRLWISGF